MSWNRSAGTKEGRQLDVDVDSQVQKPSEDCPTGTTVSTDEASESSPDTADCPADSAACSVVDGALAVRSDPSPMALAARSDAAPMASTDWSSSSSKMVGNIFVKNDNVSASRDKTEVKRKFLPGRFYTRRSGNGSDEYFTFSPNESLPRRGSDSQE